MPALTRRREPDRHQECWHIYYGDIPVGRITERAGVPVDVDQWEWAIGFYPVDHGPGGTAETFEQARAAFEAAWLDYLHRCTEADFAENRRHRAFTAWKYRMHDTGTPLPTQMTNGRSQCFCGAPLTNNTVDALCQPCCDQPAILARSDAFTVMPAPVNEFGWSKTQLKDPYILT